jgi:uncharacterized protein
VAVDGSGLRVLSEEECLQLLATVTIGRIALSSSQAMPLILPCYFSLDGRTVVLRTRHGTSLHRATDGHVVAFEADGPIGAAEPTWSVAAVGMASHPPEAPPTDDHQMRRVEIEIREISGRALPAQTSEKVHVARW